MLGQRVASVASALEAHGVKAGDRVAILAKNTNAHFELFFAAVQIRAVLVPLNWRLAPGELQGVIEDSNACVLVVGEEFLGRVSGVHALPSGPKHIFVLGAEEGQDFQQAFSESAVTAYESLYEAPDAVGRAELIDDDVALQIYTSGTTGEPKGVMLTNRNLRHVVRRLGEVAAFTQSSKNIVTLPLFHIGGMAWALAGMTAGGTATVLSDFKPRQVLDLIASGSATHLACVPIMLTRLLQDAERRGELENKIKCIAFGGAPATPDLFSELLDVFGCKLVHFFGQTEVSGFATNLQVTRSSIGALSTEKLRSCGQPFEGVDIGIRDPETGQELSSGEVGEVWIKSHQNMAGYWNKPDETASTLTPDGWLRTGDAGYLDMDGYLFLVDRVKDMIISGGENIYPAEVEAVLLTHPSVEHAAVVGVPSKKWGEAVKAVVVTKLDTALTEEEIIEHCKANLASYKAPTSVDFTDEFPRNASGKVLRRALREQYWAGYERRIS